MHSYLVYLHTYKLGQENEFQFVCKHHLIYVLYGWKFLWVQFLWISWSRLIHKSY